MKLIFGAPLDFGWNAKKAAANLLKHKVAFEAVEHFEFDGCITEEDDRFDYDEDRYVSIGFIGARMHVLVFTLRHMNRRVGTLLNRQVGTLWVISLRKANRREINRYARETE